MRPFIELWHADDDDRNAVGDSLAFGELFTARRAVKGPFRSATGA